MDPGSAACQGVPTMLGKLFVSVVAVALPLNAMAIGVARLQDGDLDATRGWRRAGIGYLQTESEVSRLVISLEPGRKTGWHTYRLPSWCLVLEGTIKVTFADGRIRQMQSGETLDEIVGKRHSVRNIGDGPAKLAVFYLSASERPIPETQDAGDTRR